MNRAMWYLVVATSVFSVINVIVKYLSHLPATEVVVFRAFISLIICGFFIWRKGGNFIGNNKKVLLLRGIFGTSGLLSLFICLQNMPLAVAITLINLTPIFTVIIAHLYLKERARPLQWLFLVFSFVGVFMVRGSVDPVAWGWILLGLFAALSAAMAYTCVRYLRLTEDPLVVILYFPLVTVPLVGPVMVYQWQTPVGSEWLLLIAIGVLTQVAQYFMTLAYQMETAANVMIFNYAGLFWGVLFGYSLFDETLSVLQLLGVLLVFVCLCGNYFVSHRQKRHLKKPRS